MREIDKNDVDVAKLFNWKKPVDIVDSDGSTNTIWMRVVGDNDLQRARVHGFRKSAEMRKRLHVDDSDERVAFLVELGQFANKEALIEVILLLRMDSYRTKAIKNAQLPLPTEPRSDAGTEAHEKYQKEVDEYPKKYSQLIAQHMQDLTKEDRQKLNEYDFSVLYREYEKLQVDALAKSELERAYFSKLVFYACYADEDCTVPLFDDFEVFDNAPARLKDLLISEYQLLDITLDTLKK